MKIIKEDNKQIRCDDCRTLLEYDSSDVHQGYITCPWCGYGIYVGNFISFPKDYRLNNGADIGNERINTYVKEGIEFLRNHQEAEHYYIGTGNTIICIFRNDELEEFNVYVCKIYYSTEIEY